MLSHHPMLNAQTRQTQTYRIANLFYVALFGGAFALTALGLSNCRMLRIRGARLWFLVLLSVILVSSKVAYGFLDAHHLMPVRVDFRFSLFKLADLLLFLLYYHTLKVPYRLHMIYHSSYRNMSYRGVAVYVCLLGIVLDLILYGFLYRY